ncbi:Uncharacterised protein [Proteus vulgaris]|uniref:hypothetical protein n=1 Tax=Proteus vulgaris TaxID=585 RepID=UPI000DF9694F|nr:hypothetical protein [Proteus vulgaris]SUC18458.1 Uncharacterised protein [Proteus vulgaris]
MNYQLRNLNLYTRIAVFRGLMTQDDKLNYMRQLVEDILPVQGFPVVFGEDLDCYRYINGDNNYFFKLTFDECGNIEEFSIKQN